MPKNRKSKRPRRKRGPTNVPTQSGNSYSNPSMDQHTELVQDVILVSTGGNAGIHNYLVQAGVNQLVLTDPLSGTVTYQYGGVGGAFQNLANWWVTYSILSVQVTVQLYNITSGVINSPFLAATEAAELDQVAPFTYEELAQTGRLTVSNSMTGSISRSQRYSKYIRDNLPNPYLNTMSTTTSARETYPQVYGATPVVQIGWQSQVSNASTDFEIPKFIAVVTTNTRFHFRGRRTYYPTGLNSFSLPQLGSPPKQDKTQNAEPEERDSESYTILQTPPVVLSPSPETEIQALKRKLAALMSTSSACANGA